MSQTVSLDDVIFEETARVKATMQDTARHLAVLERNLHNEFDPGPESAASHRTCLRRCLGRLEARIGIIGHGRLYGPDTGEYLEELSAIVNFITSEVLRPLQVSPDASVGEIDKAQKLALHELAGPIGRLNGLLSKIEGEQADAQPREKKDLA